jgi:WG containing repeat
MIKKIYFIGTFSVAACALSYMLYHQRSKAESMAQLTACIARLERINLESSRIRPVALAPFSQQYQQLGYKNLKGEVVIPATFTEARHFFYGRAVVADRNWYKGFINEKGELVIPFQFAWVSDFSKGMAIFSGTKSDRNLNGVIDLNGQILFTFKGADPIPDFIGFDQYGKTTVCVNNSFWDYGNPVSKKYGYVDCTGKVHL